MLTIFLLFQISVVSISKASSKSKSSGYTNDPKLEIGKYHIISICSEGLITTLSQNMLSNQLQSTR